MRATHDGFSVVEVVVAMAAAMGLLAMVLVGFSGMVSFSRVQPAAVDIVQRARVALDLVAADLMHAGAGAEVGPAAGALSCCLPAVEPRRLGTQRPDPAGVARADAITVVFSTAGSLSAALGADLIGAAPVLTVSPGPACPGGLPLCGLNDDATVVVLDGRGQHSYYILSAPAGGPAWLTPRQAGEGYPYLAGAAVVPVESHTYYFDAAQRQLRHYDGRATDVPIVDNVIQVSVTYHGDPAPPRRPAPLAGTANCLYDASGQLWPTLVHLPASGSLIDLPLSMFTDGPWCGSGPARFDADLLRIRRVRMHVRLQGPADLRGQDAQFAAAGTSQSAMRLVPDMDLTVDVAPRNLNGGR